MKSTMVRAELKTIGTVDVDASAELPSWCHQSDKLNVLFKPCHCQQTYSHFLFLNLFGLKMYITSEFCKVKFEQLICAGI